MNILGRLRRKTVYILPSANASMVSRYADGFRDGRAHGYAAGIKDAIEVLETLGGPSGGGNYTKVVDRADAIEAVGELND